MTTDGIEETVHNPHLKERTVITISLKLQQVEFLMRIKCNRPQLLLSSCTYWRPDSTCSCAGRSSPRCAGTRILIVTRVSVILNLTLVNVSQSQTRPTVSATKGVELIVEDGHSSRASLGAHWSHVAPLTSCCVKPDQCNQILQLMWVSHLSTVLR